MNIGLAAAWSAGLVPPPLNQCFLCDQSNKQCMDGIPFIYQSWLPLVDVVFTYQKLPLYSKQLTV